MLNLKMAMCHTRALMGHPTNTPHPTVEQIIILNLFETILSLKSIKYCKTFDSPSDQQIGTKFRRIFSNDIKKR